MTNLRMRDTIVIGIAQAIALFPGTSRSGVTMTAASFRTWNGPTPPVSRFSSDFP